jgi:hypothetical protein
MAESESGVARVRDYLLELTPEARALLLAEFERRVACGDAVLDTHILLRELRAVASAPRFDAFAEHAKHLALQPLEPFLIDDDPARRHPGRIASAALDRAWDWIVYDLLPDETAEFTARATQALSANHMATADALARAFQDRVAAELRAAIADSDAGRAGPLVRLRTPQAREDAQTVRWALRGRDNLAELAAALPDAIDELAYDDLDLSLAAVERACNPRDLVPYALVLLMSRLSRPWQIVRLAVEAAGVPVASRVSETAYGVAIPMLLAELERLLAELNRASLAQDAEAGVEPIRQIAAYVRGLRSEIEIPVASTLGRHLAAVEEEAGRLAKSLLAMAPLPARSARVPLSA